MRTLVVLLGLLLTALPVAAEMTPAPPKSTMPPAPSAEQEYGRGVAATKAREWSVAAAECLGEAYVKMGRLDDARRVLERLTPLDASMARGARRDYREGEVAAYRRAKYSVTIRSEEKRSTPIRIEARIIRVQRAWSAKAGRTKPSSVS